MRPCSSCRSRRELSNGVVNSSVDPNLALVMPDQSSWSARAKAFKISGPKNMNLYYLLYPSASGKFPKNTRIHYFYGLWPGPAPAYFMGFPVGFHDFGPNQARPQGRGVNRLLRLVPKQSRVLVYEFNPKQDGHPPERFSFTIYRGLISNSAHF